METHRRRWLETPLRTTLRNLVSPNAADTPWHRLRRTITILKQCPAMMAGRGQTMKGHPLRLFSWHLL